MYFLLILNSSCPPLVSSVILQKCIDSLVILLFTSFHSVCPRLLNKLSSQPECLFPPRLFINTDCKRLITAFFGHLVCFEWHHKVVPTVSCSAVYLQPAAWQLQLFVCPADSEEKFRSRARERELQLADGLQLLPFVPGRPFVWADVRVGPNTSAPSQGPSFSRRWVTLRLPPLCFYVSAAAV